MICESEGINAEQDELFNVLVDITGGDLRRSINML